MYTASTTRGGSRVHPVLECSIGRSRYLHIGQVEDLQSLLNSRMDKLWIQTPY